MSRGVAATGQVPLHVVERGSGTAVAVLHGFTGSASAMADLTDRLAHRHRVIVIDLPGHGSSPAPGPGDSMADVVSVVDRTLAALGIQSAHLAGYSMGGRVALSHAVAHPDRVRSLFLIGASAGIADAASRRTRRDADEALAGRIEDRGIGWFVDHWTALPILQPVSPQGRAARPRARSLRLNNDPQALAAALRAMGTGHMAPLHRELVGIGVPVAVLAGETDEKYRAAADEMAAALPDGRSIVVPDSGHAAHVDAPGIVAAMALDFFAEVEGQAR